MTHVGPVLLALLVLGCSHAEPFAVSDPMVDGPFAPGAIARLTFAEGVSAASWLPAGDTLALAARDEGRHEGDICLFLLPAVGGTRHGGFCSASGLQTDSVERFGAPAVSPERAVAFPYFHSRRSGPTFGSLRTGPVAIPFTTSDLSNLPFVQEGRLFQDVTDLAWQPDGSLVFLAWTDEIWEKTCPPDGNPCDELVRTPFSAVRVSPGATGPLTFLPGTHLATSVTPDGMGGLFTTFAGSDQLWQISAAGDSVAVHDFGPGSKVRGADHRAGKVAVILAGTQVIGVDDVGVLQVSDDMGILAILDLASGSTAALGPPDMFFRDPAVSPDGRSVVALGSPFILVNDGIGGIDTVLVRPSGDLWRVSVP